MTKTSPASKIPQLLTKTSPTSKIPPLVTSSLRRQLRRNPHQMSHPILLAEDHGSPEPGQLPKVWNRGRRETESRQRVSCAKNPLLDSAE